jgi:putative membrane protein
MNIVAPLLAVVLIGRVTSVRASWLWLSAVAQIVMLWASHLPPAQEAALQSHAFQVTIHAALLLSALSFWVTLLCLTDVQRWHALPALLLTGKLACLLAALLVFAPRALYGAPRDGSTLDDQHLAGLLMIVACPLSYLVAAVVISVQFLHRAADAPLRVRRAG